VVPKFVISAVVNTVDDFSVPSPAVRLLLLRDELDTSEALSVVLVLSNAVLFEAELVKSDLRIFDITHLLFYINEKKFLFL
jgi:hypothetical protein